jgi:hypothetical protein
MLDVPNYVAGGTVGQAHKWRGIAGLAAKRPRPFWAVIATRIILRGLPVESKDSLRDLVLPVFRAAAVSWTASRYPAHETELAAAAEAAAGFAFAAGPKAYPSPPLLSAKLVAPATLATLPTR